MIERYLARLEADLAERGVRGRSAARVVAESRDHLLELSRRHGERDAVERFGASADLADAVSAQLASTRTFRATYATFAALAPTAAGYLGSFALVDLGGGSPDIFAGERATVGVLASLGSILFPQVAFVAGCLAVLRAVRLRGGPTASDEELRVMRTRAAVALAAGALTMTSLAIWAVEFRDAPPLAAWVPWAVLALCATSVVPLGAGVAAVARSAGPRAMSVGPPSDVFDDLALERLRARPWRFAVLFASIVAVFAFAAGWVAEGDPGSGLIRGGFEAIAVLACFALLGRRLALRPGATRRSSRA